jgi:hypothetical protein
MLGVSPGTAVTGSPGYPEECITCDRADSDDAADAKTDIAAAYKDAASRTGAETLTEVDIAGKTFIAGLYKTSGEIMVTTGAVYLNGPGIFIFQIEKTLKVGEI